MEEINDFVKRLVQDWENSQPIQQWLKLFNKMNGYHRAITQEAYERTKEFIEKLAKATVLAHANYNTLKAVHSKENDLWSKEFGNKLSNKLDDNATNLFGELPDPIPDEKIIGYRDLLGLHITQRTNLILSQEEELKRYLE